jgi:hypothetical protein
MSTLVTQTISNGTVSTSSENVIQGSAKAWVSFVGTGTVAVRASYNVSSITDNGTGQYTVNFTNALPDVNYAVVFGTQDSPAGAQWAVARNGAAYSTTQLAIQCWNYIGNGVDLPIVNASVFR